MDEGERRGRFVGVRDVDGRLHALTVNAVLAICTDDDDGVTVLLPGGRLMRLPYSVDTVIDWLDQPPPR